MATIELVNVIFDYIVRKKTAELARHPLRIDIRGEFIEHQETIDLDGKSVILVFGHNGSSNTVEMSIVGKFCIDGMIFNRSIYEASCILEKMIDDFLKSVKFLD